MVFKNKNKREKKNRKKISDVEMEHLAMAQDAAKPAPKSSEHREMEMSNHHQNMDMSNMDMSETSDDHSGHNHGNHLKDFWIRFIVSVIFSIPIFLFSKFMGIGPILNYPQFEVIVPLAATFIFIFGGWPFFSGAVSELKRGKPSMMSLITLGLISSYGYSIYVYFDNLLNHHHQMDFFWEFATLVIIMLLGHYIEAKAIDSATKDLKNAVSLLPKKAFRVENGKVVEINTSDIKVGDTLMVKANTNIPADGQVVSGNGEVDEALLSGESSLVFKTEGDYVIGGSVNQNSELVISVTRIGKNSFVSQVDKLVESAQESKTNEQSLSQKVATALFYFALIVAIVAFLFWLFIDKSSMSYAVERAISVLVIACPHALGLAVPLVVARSISIGIKKGILVKNQQASENIKDVQFAVFDKTGTLTDGKFHVAKFESTTPAFSDEQIIQFASSLEGHSTHPLAIALDKYRRSHQIGNIPVIDFKEIPGFGVSGKIPFHGHELKVDLVNLNYLKEKKIDKNVYQDQTANTISYLLVNNEVVGYVVFQDEIRPDAFEIIQSFRRSGVTTVMLTGDNYQSAKRVAMEVDVDQFLSGLLPEEKYRFIEQLKSTNHKVIMIGDGINDAPSLALSDIGISFANGTDIAQNSADVILLDDKLSSVGQYLLLADKTRRKTIQNLWLGAGYNLIAIPLAAGVLAPWGIVISPAVGAILMTVSTVLVVLNAMRLK